VKTDKSIKWVDICKL